MNTVVIKHRYKIGISNEKGKYLIGKELERKER